MALPQQGVQPPPPPPPVIAPQTQLLDVRGEFKVGSFEGEEQKWATWVLRSRAFFALLDWAQFTDQAEGHNGPLPWTSLSAEAQAVSPHLYAWLIGKVSGRGLVLVLQAPRGQGLESWRILVQDYEPHIGGRFAAMLRTILNPSWKNEKPETFTTAVFAVGELDHGLGVAVREEA